MVAIVNLKFYLSIVVIAFDMLLAWITEVSNIDAAVTLWCSLTKKM